MERVRVCRICGRLNPGDSNWCDNCRLPLTRVAPVPQAEGQQQARIYRLRILRSRLVRTGLLIALAIGLTVWGVLVFFDLGPNPPSATTDITPSAVVGDWPQGRRNVENSGFTSEALPVPQSVSWSYKTSKALLAAPAVVGQRVYLNTEDGKTVALDRDTGQTVWEYQSGIPSRSTPAVAEDLVVVSLLHGFIVGLDRETGAVRWKKDLESVVYASPLIADGSVYIGAGDREKLYALDAATGQKRWEFDIGEWAVAEVAYADNSIVVVSSGSVIHVIDTVTGLKRFVYDTGYPRNLYGAPAIYGDTMYLSSQQGLVWAIDRTEITYPFERAIMYWKSNLAVWGILDTPPVQKGTRWFRRVGGSIVRTPAVAHDAVYVTTKKGKVLALDAATGTERWSIDLETEVTTPATVAAETVLVGTNDGTVFGLAADTGEVSWQFDIDGRISDSPIVAGGRMYVVTTSGTLYAIAGAEE